MIQKRFILMVVFVLLSFSEADTNSNFGGKIGISFQFGTHIQRIGMMYQLYYYFGSVQFNQGSQFNFNKKNLGPKESGLEFQTNLGFQVFWGGYVEYKKYLFSEYTLMAPKRNSIGYCFKYFLDKLESSQASGGLSINASRFTFVFENDLLGIAKGYEDKFRTGAASLSYQLDSFLISIQTTHWTGKSIDGKHFKGTEYPAKYGYKDLSETKHGKISHGILAARIDYYWKFGQTLRLESGVDAEQVRHILQNRLLHDHLPAAIIKYENAHYPMLQKNGIPYLFQSGQKIRPVKGYFQIGLNQMIFY